MTRKPDRLFADHRLAAIYDMVDGPRHDLDAYVRIVDELGATSVLDVGCGTGELAWRLAERGIDVVGVDPAAASLDIARTKPHADRVRWLLGDATTLPRLCVDLATMTGNVAQVFLTDREWSSTVAAVAAALRPGGHFVFETRDPAYRAWEGWTPDVTRRRVGVDGVGVIETWCEVTSVDDGLVTFTSTYVFERDRVTLTSRSTLRFHSRVAIERSLDDAGLDVIDVRDAPDRPAKELVVIARRR